MLEAEQCLEVQTRSYEEIIAAGEIWSLSDIQVSAVTVQFLPGCWGSRQRGCWWFVNEALCQCSALIPLLSKPG